MSAMGELHASQDDDMMECMLVEEEQSYYNAINEVRSFIQNGSVTFDKVIEDLGVGCCE